MEIIEKATDSAIQRAASALKKGNLVAFPTETVYGLGADFANREAVRKIYKVKNRPKNHPLILHIFSINELFKVTESIPPYALKLAQTFWPGPMTLVLPRANLVKNFITGGQDSVGVRIPDNTISLKLLKAFKSINGLAIAAPSANKFGKLSPTNHIAVKNQIGKNLGKNDFILNGGDCKIGIESTIIECLGNYPIVLRPGAITVQMISEVVSRNVFISRPQDSVRVSGGFAKHYAPAARLLVDEIAKPGEGLIAMQEVPTPKGAIRLTSPKSDYEFAKNLYKAMAKADALGIKTIVVIQPKGQGIAEAVRDRITKASNNK